MKNIFFSFLVCLLFCSTTNASDTLYLRDNLRRAEKGDFIVTHQGKSYSLIRVYDKSNRNIAIEEITIPSCKVPRGKFSWRNWVSQGAPDSSSRVVYHIDLSNAEIEGRFCLTRSGWYEAKERDNFLSTLLNLQLELIPSKQRRRVGLIGTPGISDKRPAWQPKVIVDGQAVEGVPLDAWKTTWPKDGSELSGREIEAYVPAENSLYPSYFPYWLQINGMIGSAKIRIVDSGRNLTD